MLRFIIIFLISFKAFTCPTKSGYVTGELVYVPVNALVKNDMTQNRFNEIISWFFSHYESVIKDQGGELKIISDWEESMANAFAQREDNTWIIRVLGGMSRHHLISEDAFIFVLCHEMGHHIGGAPKKREIFSTSWASNEGQADYYAALKCMRKLFKDQNNEHIVQSMSIEPLVRKECKESFTTLSERNLCIRISMASLSHAKFLNRRDEIHSPVSFSTPDPKVVRRTSHNHPSPQCRLDTGFQGAICDVDQSVEVSQSEAFIGTCHQFNGDLKGLRPSCWYSAD